MPDRIGTGAAARPLTVEQAAEHLGCSGAHIRDLCREGKIRHFRLGRLIRIPAAAMEELECASSGSATVSTPTGESMAGPDERRSELRIVKSPSDG